MSHRQPNKRFRSPDSLALRRCAWAASLGGAFRGIVAEAESAFPLPVTLPQKRKVQRDVGADAQGGSRAPQLLHQERATEQPGPDAQGETHLSRRVPEARPRVFDAHLHLDRLHRALGLHPKASLIEVGRAELLQEGVQPVAVGGGIAVYCDPVTYPTFQEISSVVRQPHCEVDIGIHPKKKLTATQFERLRFLTGSRDVKVLGEIGLDHTQPPSDWPRQDDLLKRVLGECYMR
ncbi:uncharacterized protein LOC117121944 [Anneissia japonica]|uniref:uncharacterized protein LOC117121944 n=1 Tax=Anneissia japonica TaxID=1529436 RepID=UPI00142577A8|nr:uncharacterized protein LOC117121944 [Anneissia japonica]